MDYSKKLKKPSIEALADLWADKNFQELVRVLRINQENCAKACLTRTNMESVIRLQEEARAYSLVVKTVEDAYRKVNKLSKKRRTK